MPKTEFTANTVTITSKRCVEDRALLGDGRDRMTLAHELGHGVMHYGEAVSRPLRRRHHINISANAWESAEHQAKVFASAFLIDEEVAVGMSAKEISKKFGVGLEAAEICFKRLLKKAERVRSAERVLKMNEEVKAAMLTNTKRREPTYLNDICTGCHQRTLIPIGNNQVFCRVLWLQRQPFSRRRRSRLIL